MTKLQPNVVPGEAAGFALRCVFERRRADWIQPREIVTQMVADGYGLEFPSEVRKKRVKTWVLQVLRRLRKRGWLGAPGPEGWATMSALRGLDDPAALAKKAPVADENAPPESWEGFIQDWVFEHRDAEFGVAEVAVAVVQRGFGRGEIGGRLDGARELIEKELRTLQWDGLVSYDEQDEFWHPTELLKDWPR